ncbi:MAG: hypothetical protein K9I94_10965 [Bacteroidales bacterium]|nr:hypothetical protein [Bacteroidales bacterium]
MKKTVVLFAAITFLFSSAFAQQTPENKQEKNNDKKALQYFRAPGYDGLNVFETPKQTDVEFDGLDVRLGGDFALQFQGLDHSNAAGAPELIPLGSNINLPAANLNIDVQLHNGVRLHMRTYLSSRHHNESWVKGGYIQIDKLDFIRESFADDLMDVLTLRAGMDQPSYGDAKYRRSDNAKAIYNPFVGNYIMDAFTTEPFLEATFHLNDFIIMGGVTNGMLHPTVNNSQTGWGSDKFQGEIDDLAPTYYGKLGLDKQINDDLRMRLTGSVYTAQGTDNGNHLYSGDRAGARYYKVLSYIAPSDSSVVTNFRSGRFNPGFNKETAFQINPFVKYKGLEFFGVFEQTTGSSGRENLENGTYTQLGAELLYRFGSWDQFYIGSRFNSVSGHGDYASGSTAPDNKSVNRLNIGGGWFMTKNTLVKLEYVNQNYDENFTNQLKGANFSGAVLEAVVSF